MKRSRDSGVRGAATLVVAPARNRYSQTFVRNHIKHLDGRVEVLFGRAFKLETEEGTPLVSRTWNALAGVADIAGRAGVVRRRAKSQAVAGFCRSRDIGVAMAEFGPTAAAISGDLEHADVPLVAHFHGYDAYDEDTLAEWLPRYRNMFERRTEVVVVSEHMRKQVIELGAREDGIHVIRVGVDTELFSGAAPATAPPRFLVVGRFVEKKAPQLAVEAFSRAHQQVPELRLTMIGDGPLLDETVALAASLGVADAVEFLGRRSNDDVAALMRESRGLLQHSVRAVRGDCEGTPVVVMEAMASGLPVIGSNHTGIGEVIEHERTGLLSTERDIDGTAAHLVRLANDPGLATRLGEAAAIDARAHHRLEDSIAKLSGVLEGVRSAGR